MTAQRLRTGSFGVLYQEVGGNHSNLPQTLHETLILEERNVSAFEVKQMQDAGKSVILYVSIAETSHIRDYWDAAWTQEANGLRDDTTARTADMPDWISDHLSGASGRQARLVEYWRDEWKAIVFDEVERLLTSGGNGANKNADGVFLDNVLAWDEWRTFSNARTDQDFAVEMAQLVAEASAHARAIKPDARIVINGDPYLPWVVEGRVDVDGLDYRAKLLDSVSAILQEGVFHRDGAAQDLTNPDGSPTAQGALVNALKLNFVDNGIPVFALDYVEGAQNVAAFARMAVQAGFLPYAEELDLALDDLQPALNVPTPGDDVLYAGPTTGLVDAGAGDDVIHGSDGDDEISTGPGSDTVHGGDGVDRVHFDGTSAFHLHGWSARPDGGIDVVSRGAGTDTLYDVEQLHFTDRTVAVADLLALPNLTVTAFSADAAAATPGGTVGFAWTVTNDGAAAAGGPSVIALYETVGGAETRIDAVVVGDLAAGASASGVFSAAFASELDGADHAFAARADDGGAIGESDETDNRSDALVVTTPATAPDLVVASVSANAAQAAAGTVVSFSYVIANNGDGAAGGSSVAVLRHFFDGAEIGGGSDLVPDLAAGARASGVIRVTLDEGLEPGRHSFALTADGLDAVSESDETNNAGGVVHVALVADGGPDPRPLFTAGDDDVALPGPGAYAALGGADTVRGSAGADLVRGGGGDDRIAGRGGADDLRGGAGADRLDGQAGADRLQGGGGRDDLFGGAGADDISGGGGADFLVGGGGADALRGGAGADEFLGGGRGDLIEGGAGFDILDGGAGADTLIGGRGEDRLTGGRGADMFVFERRGGEDAVVDFGRGADAIDLTDFGFASERRALARFSQDGADVEFEHRGASFKLLDVSLDDISARDLRVFEIVPLAEAGLL